MIVNWFCWFYWCRFRTRFCGPQWLELLFSFVCVFVFVSVIPRVLHLCVLFLSACYDGLCYEYTWVFGLFRFFLHWYLGDFMRIMFHGHHSKTNKKKKIVFGFFSFGSHSCAVWSDLHLRKPLAVCSLAFNAFVLRWRDVWCDTDFSVLRFPIPLSFCLSLFFPTVLSFWTAPFLKLPNRKTCPEATPRVTAGLETAKERKREMKGVLR